MTVTAAEFDDSEAPGSGFCTLTATVPVVAAFPVATSSVFEMYCVGRELVPKSTSAPGTNTVPITSMLNAPRPIVPGLATPTDGIGFEIVTAPVAVAASP